MNIALWIIAGLLAVAFLAAGAMKLLQPKDELAASGMAWVGDFSPATIRAIGALEVLGVIGLILPAALDIVPVIVPIAAAGLAALMLGAVVTHARRKEGEMVAVNLVLFVSAAAVVAGRFGPQPFTA